MIPSLSNTLLLASRPSKAASEATRGIVEEESFAFEGAVSFSISQSAEPFRSRRGT
jgi:hypothetical protein